MPRSNREYMLRFADSAINNLEYALGELGRLRNIYAGGAKPLEGAEQLDSGVIEPVEGLDHPEHRQAVEMIAAIVLQAHELLTTFRREVM